MSLISYLRKRKLTRVSCPTCGDTCYVGTPPGDFILDFQCARPECVQQHQVQAYIPNDEHSMYFVTEDENGTTKCKLGSDSDPFSLEMYERLDIEHTATSEEILDAYNRRRLDLNPPDDLNRCMENAAETARVEEAYKKLSEPITRRKYNKFGLTTDCVMVGQGRFPHILGALTNMLGDGNFYDIIGTPILLPRMAEKVRLKRLNQQHDEPGLFQSFIADRVLLRIEEALNEKLHRYHPDNADEFRNGIKIEAGRLRRHRNGLKILHAVGYVYSTLGKYYAAKYSNDNERVIKLARHEAYWQGIFHFSQLLFDLGKAIAKCKHACYKERQYLAKEWRTVTLRQQLRERYLRVLNEKYWTICKFEFELRIWVVCETLIFRGERDHIVGIRREVLERKANGLRVIGEIYENEL